MDSTSEIYDVIVIGAGINGSSAALHLARAGKNTALVEQFPAVHSRGSSAGQSRIFRRCHFSFDSFDAIIEDSHRQWLSLEEESGVSLLRPHKLYFISKKSNAKEINQVRSSIINSVSSPVMKSIQEFNKEHGTTFAQDKVVIEDSDGGILMAEKCIQTIQELFKKSGGKIIDEFPVAEISVQENGLVHLNGYGYAGTLKAKSLVVCAGPWTSKMLKPLGVDLPLKVVKVDVLYWPLLEDGRKSFSFLDHCDGKGEIYGLPSIEYPGMVKICFHDGEGCDPDHRDLGGNDYLKNRVSRYIDENFPWIGGQPVIEERCMYTICFHYTEGCDPDQRDLVGNNDYLRNKISRFIDENFPWIGGQPVIQEHCMYTMTPDREMIIDRHEKYNNIVFACGFSGTGFKTGPTVGKILSEMIVGGKQSLDYHDFNLKRFHKKNQSKL